MSVTVRVATLRESNIDENDMHLIAKLNVGMGRGRLCTVMSLCMQGRFYYHSLNVNESLELQT